MLPLQRRELLALWHKRKYIVQIYVFQKTTKLIAFEQVDDMFDHLYIYIYTWALDPHISNAQMQWEPHE